MIRLRDQVRHTKLEFGQQVRQLEVDKRNLEEHCTELSARLREADNRLHANRTGRVMSHKKPPFYTTVSSGNIFGAAVTAAAAVERGQSPADRCTDRCACLEHFKDMQKFQLDNRGLKEAIGELQKQVYVVCHDHQFCTISVSKRNSVSFI